jgi:hypothetical protein
MLTQIQKVLVVSVCLAAGFGAAGADTAAHFRPPAVPLVTSDPYLSIWSEADHLTDDVTRHWTHQPHPLISLIRVDGAASRLMGDEPESVPAMPQVGLEVTPTRSIYEFQDSKIHVTLTFMTAALPHDLDVLSRPLTYITWTVRSLDGAPHAVTIYDSVSGLLTVNKPDEPVTWGREEFGGLSAKNISAKGLINGGLTALRIGTTEQSVLGSSGDDHRINWGYAYAAASARKSQSVIGENKTLLRSFVDLGVIPEEDDSRKPRPANEDQPVMAFIFDLGAVEAKPVSRHVMVAYDEIYAIKYFGKDLRPYWRRNGATPATMLQEAESDYDKLTKRCEEFDRNLMADLTRIGGVRYARIVALAYRQCLAACGLAADAKKQPLLFTKENTSNGDIATVDVIFPMDPIFILLSPALAKSSIVPILSYSASSHWKFPNAPHDLGTYPLAPGRDDGGEGMPVEESGNMLILCDAIAKDDGNANFVTPWWPQLTQWAKYLEQYGLDPEDQLCTDDFMGHLAHNANLSVKAILGLAAYGDLCRRRGDSVNAEKYDKLARTDAEHWLTAAGEGDHYKLAFDKPNTWSQKYNLVWDRLLGLNVFPPEVARKETAYYKKMLQPFGVPLDSRTHLTKTDWSFWIATMADNQAEFEGFISPIYDYLNTTTSRMPLVDSYVTDDIKSDGFHARPVVGGLFIKMLTDADAWKKWSGGDLTHPANWAPLPSAPKITEIVPSSRETPVPWRYTTDKPGKDWAQPKFDATSWNEGSAGFGTYAPGAVVRTIWNTGDIWLRREFVMPSTAFSNLKFLVFHDEDVEIYVNGVAAASEAGFSTSYVPLNIDSSALKLLKPGAHITLAAHCHQTVGGQDIDIGLADVHE